MQQIKLGFKRILNWDLKGFKTHADAIALSASDMDAWNGPW
jgi:hypothetical protein